MKFSGLASLGVRKVCSLGIVLGLTMGLFTAPYIQWSWRVATNEGTYTKLSPFLEAISDRSSYSIASHEYSRRSERAITLSEKGNFSGLEQPLNDRSIFGVGGYFEDGKVNLVDRSETRSRTTATNAHQIDHGLTDQSCASPILKLKDESEGELQIKSKGIKNAGRRKYVDKSFTLATASAGREFGHGNLQSSQSSVERAPVESAAAVSGQSSEAIPLRTSVNPGTSLKFKDEDVTLQLHGSTGRFSLFRNSSTQKDQGLCNIFKGNWYPDPLGPLYSSNSCSLTQAQNCQGNGRPDREYESYRWQPHDCDLPRLDPLKFLEFMQGKTLAFIGDSVARNQYESLVCILAQVSTAKKTGNKVMQKWHFPSHELTLVGFWSGWLVRQSKDPFSFAPNDSIKLFLEELDEYASFMPTFHVTVLSSGHRWMRKTAYVIDGKIRGGIGWKVRWKAKKFDLSEAFGVAMTNALYLISSIPNYNGLTILRTYSPDHYEGGHWDTGGSCTGKVQPFTIDQLPRNSFNEMMRTKQLDAFESATRKGLKGQNNSTLVLLDVFEAVNYRADGHPGPYRNRDPNKQTKRDKKGNPPPQDCLHWCMPGPVDTMNQMLFEIMKRELNAYL